MVLYRILQWRSASAFTATAAMLFLLALVVGVL